MAATQPAIAADESPTPDNPRRAAQRGEQPEGPPQNVVGVCGAGAGSCYATHPTPGCDDPDCCAAVCAVDPFCCNNSWDSICVGEALDLCGNCGDPGNGSCFSQHGTPGCNNADCCAAVCAIDPYCCNEVWDGICVDEAQQLCAGCGDPSNGSCFASHLNPGCNNGACCALVCDVDPFCCSNEWDDICVGEAFDLCNGCGDPAVGSCYVPHATPFCNDSACCSQVCAVDPFCCNNSWDSICVDQAQTLCAGCGAPGNGSCFSAHASTGCNNGTCCATVCDIDPYCCETQWDGICASEAAQLCGGCGDPASGSCYASHGNTGCNNEDCCATVCALDPYCCETSWDSLCVNEAEDLCGCVADIAPLGGNGIVNVDDLLAVINAWGACFDCPADLVPPGNNGQVNVDDLLKVINSWGACTDLCSAPFSCGGTLVVCPNGEAGCFCWDGPNGSNVCAPDFFCSNPPCPDGNCPPGMVCVTNSCCGTPICAPICGLALEGPPAPGEEISPDTLMSSGRRYGDRPAQ